jgi:hypothetical protein
MGFGGPLITRAGGSNGGSNRRAINDDDMRLVRR